MDENHSKDLQNGRIGSSVVCPILCHMKNTRKYYIEDFDSSYSLHVCSKDLNVYI